MNALTEEIKTSQTHATVHENKNLNRTYSPNVNITEDTTKIVILVEMPGVSQSGVDISIEKEELTLEGKREVRTIGTEAQILREYVEGDYSRKFKLGKNVDLDNVKAKMKNGLLELTLPKLEPKKTKIQIQS